MASRRLVLWDFNGTLLDDAHLCLECLNELLRRRGRPGLSFERYREVFDFPVVDFYERIGFDFSKESFEVPAQEWVELYHERVWTQARLHEGALDVLKALAAAGWTQGVLSAYQRGMLEKLLAHLGIRAFFDPVLGLDDHYAASKVELGRGWIASSGLAPESLVLVGDTLHDLETARAMGIRCVLVARGYQVKSRLLGKDVPVLDDIRQVAGELLGRLPGY
ncbi:MAG TPA: hypothetical protein DCM05_16130 [Elusimicrobia bacterium]|nr:hypothetical protein [Elusimicrobiota bacterium]